MTLMCYFSLFFTIADVGNLMGNILWYLVYFRGNLCYLSQLKRWIQNLDVNLDALDYGFFVEVVNVDAKVVNLSSNLDPMAITVDGVYTRNQLSLCPTGVLVGY